MKSQSKNQDQLTLNRPLPEEMFFYARADTHFLLYIYDNMRNELIDRSDVHKAEDNKMEIVLQKSKDTSLLRYERQVYNSESGKGAGGWYNLLVKTPAMFTKEQFAVFRAVHEWRDRIAREDDDSCPFVMPNHVIFSIAKHLPQDVIALFGTAHPISHNVKSRAQDLLEVIKQAQANAPNGPSMMDVLRPDSVGAAVNAHLPHVASSKEASPLSMFPEVDEAELRSNRSSFWGGAFGSSIWETPTSVNGQDESITLAIPFPAAASEVLTSTSTPVAPSPQVRSAQVSPSPTPEVPQAFTLRRGPNVAQTVTPAKKRKSDAISADNTPAASTPGENSISLNASSSSEDEETQAKRLRKEEKRRAKAEKRARKAQTSQTTSGEEVLAEDEPFDYSAAPKVTGVDKGKREKKKKDPKKGKKEGKGGKVEEEETAGWDPYKKSMDAGKGMRRVQSERAGRSGIFKN